MPRNIIPVENIIFQLRILFPGREYYSRLRILSPVEIIFTLAKYHTVLCHAVPYRAVPCRRVVQRPAGGGGVHMYIYMYTHVHTRAYTCTYIHIYTHSELNIPLRSVHVSRVELNSIWWVLLRGVHVSRVEYRIIFNTWCTFRVQSCHSMLKWLRIILQKFNFRSEPFRTQHHSGQ